MALIPCGGSTFRSWGMPRKVDVISTQPQFDRAWPEFVKSLGGIHIIGMKCKWNDPATCTRMRQQNIDLDTGTCRSDRPNYQEPLKCDEYPFACDEKGDLCKDAIEELELIYGEDSLSPLLEHRTRHVENASVTLVQLASIGGHVLLIRTCFTDLPQQLREFLISFSTIVVGMGLVGDLRRLQSSYSCCLVSNPIDIREVFLRWPWFVSQYHFRQFGAHSLGEFFFNIDSNLFYFPYSYWFTRILQKEQVIATSLQAQLYIDLFLFCCLRVNGWALPSNWNEDKNFAQVLWIIACEACGKTYLDKQYVPASLIRTLPSIGAKRCYSECVTLSKPPLVAPALWAYPLPKNIKMLTYFLTRYAGSSDTKRTGLPARGIPAMYINLNRVIRASEMDILVNEGYKEMTLTSKALIHGKRVVIKMKVTFIEGPDSGGDGTGDPMELKNLVSTPKTQTWSDRYNILHNCALLCVKKYVEFIDLSKMKSVFANETNLPHPEPQKDYIPPNEGQTNGNAAPVVDMECDTYSVESMVPSEPSPFYHPQFVYRNGNQLPAPLRQGGVRSMRKLPYANVHFVPPKFEPFSFIGNTIQRGLLGVSNNSGGFSIKPASEIDTRNISQLAMALNAFPVLCDNGASSVLSPEPDLTVCPPNITVDPPDLDDSIDPPNGSEFVFSEELCDEDFCEDLTWNEGSRSEPNVNSPPRPTAGVDPVSRFKSLLPSNKNDKNDSKTKKDVPVPVRPLVIPKKRNKDSRPPVDPNSRKQQSFAGVSLFKSAIKGLKCEGTPPRRKDQDNAKRASKTKSEPIKRTGEL